MSPNPLPNPNPLRGRQRTAVAAPVAAAAAMACLAGPALATNGMNMEGYGPISSGMGGVSQAVDHGTAAMAQNPATLALMTSPARLDVAVGRLGPRVSSSVPGMPTADSGGTSYWMPAIGYARKSGSLTWGLGVFAQGGMGTEYGADSFLAAGSGRPVRSELGVGRVLLPLVWQATPELAIGGSVDFVWANLDLRMAASGAQLGQMVTGGSGNLYGALPALGGASWARIDFSNSNDFTGAAKATGWAGKLGLVWRAAPEVSLGASYQFKTSLGDMKTSRTGATLSASPDAGSFTDSGRMTVVDFQWPAMAALGVAWQATPTVLVGADVKRIEWADVMKSFKMRYDSAGIGGSVSLALPQHWKNQTVTNVGVAWSANAQLTLRAGVNHADNAIPDLYVNPIFPATVEDHYTLGLGYAFTPAHELNVSYAYAPRVKVTSGGGVTITHKQHNVQLMYSARF
ncbi:MAG: outer membrane protein transport protein [Proteobacteria bacterium]|nr:outer membrane protein transport protein [Pseudomonadota bacterium]